MIKLFLAGACLLFAGSGVDAQSPVQCLASDGKTPVSCEDRRKAAELPSKDICRVFGQNSSYCQAELKREQAKEQAKKDAEEAKKPDNILKQAYHNYIMVKTCYEVRKGFKYVWINETQMYEAKQYASEIEKKLNIRNHDEIWASIDAQKIHDSVWTTSQYTGVRAEEVFAMGQSLCQMAHESLRQTYNQVLQQPVLKKDF
jgi:hypothetical protein